LAMLCSVCNNAQVEEINKEIISGTPIRRIAARFGLSASAVARHKKKHLPETLLQAREAAEVAHADDLLAQVQELQAKALRILQQAERQGDFKIALSGIKEARACLELLAKLQGELQNDIIIRIERRRFINEIAIIVQEEIKDPVKLERITNRLLSLGVH